MRNGKIEPNGQLIPEACLDYIDGGKTTKLTHNVSRNAPNTRFTSASPVHTLSPL